MCGQLEEPECSPESKWNFGRIDIFSLAKSFNIFRKHLGRRSLHLSEHGTSRVAMNCNAAVRKL